MGGGGRILHGVVGCCTRDTQVSFRLDLSNRNTFTGDSKSP